MHGARYETRDAARAEVFEYIEVVYNRVRRHTSINGVSPVTFYETWLKQRSARQAAWGACLLVLEKPMEGQFVNWQSWWNPIEGQPAKLEQAKSFEFKTRRFISVVFIAPILLWVILRLPLLWWRGLNVASRRTNRTNLGGW